jgi:hypothetical protein
MKLVGVLVLDSNPEKEHSFKPVNQTTRSEDVP